MKIKEKNKPYYIILWMMAFIFLFSFSFSKTAKADVTQPNLSTLSNDKTLTTYQYLGSYLSGNFSQLQLYGKASSTLGGDEAWNITLSNASRTTTSTCGTAGWTNLGSFAPVSVSSTLAFRTATIATTTLDSTKQYCFGISQSGFSNTYVLGGASTTSTFPRGNYSASPPANLYFRLFNITALSSISIDAPGDGSTIPDFQAWEVSWINAPSSSVVLVEYGQTTSTLNFLDSIDNVTEGTSGANILKRNSLTFNNQNGPFQWYVRGTLTNQFGITIATSSIISFQITSSTPTRIPQSSNGSIDTNYYNSISGYQSTSSLTTLCVYNCTQYDGPFFSSSTVQGLACYARQVVCYAGQTLFMPSTDVKTSLQNGMNSFSSVFPFSIIFTLASTTNSTANNSFSSSSLYALNLPVMGTSTTIPLLNSSTLANVITTTQKENIFTALRAALWVGTASVITLIIL